MLIYTLERKTALAIIFTTHCQPESGSTGSFDVGAAIWPVNDATTHLDLVSVLKISATCATFV